jgi:hypothetical protein
LPALSQAYAYIVSVASHVAKFVNLYGKAFMFFRNVLIENNSPFEQHNDFVCSCCSDGPVKFSTGVTEHIEERSYISKSVTVLVSLVWLIHIDAKM